MVVLGGVPLGGDEVVRVRVRMGLVSLQRRPHTAPRLPSKDTELSKDQEAVPPGTESAGALTLDFPGFSTVRKKVGFGAT